MKNHIINSLTIKTKITEWIKRPAMFGHPESEVWKPKVEVNLFVAMYKNGEAINKNNNPDIIEVIHLSLDE